MIVIKYIFIYTYTHHCGVRSFLHCTYCVTFAFESTDVGENTEIMSMKKKKKGERGRINSQIQFAYSYQLEAACGPKSLLW